eukprot:XP_011678165.1 PREDICTED: uncharacterized protein LOC105444946 [Strongylocentrotus purpuratus]
MPRKKRQVAMNPSRALQSLRRIKNIQPDELGDLGFILSSETSPLVRCHNHSFTVAMQKQMDIWYRHHVTTMRKLSHGQQSEYRNLMKVKNDKRRMYRSGVMRQRDEDEFDIRMKIERDRNEAEVKLLNLTLDDYRTDIDVNVDLQRKESDRSGWLRLRKRDPMNSSDPLPTIYDIDDVQHRDSPTSELVNDQEYPSGRDIDDTHKRNGLEDDEDGDADIMREDLRTTDRLVRSSNDDETEQDQTEHGAAETQQDHAEDEQSKKDISVSHRHVPFNIVDSGAKCTNHHKLDVSDHGALDMKTPAVVLKDFGDHHGETDGSQGDSHAVSNNARKTALNMKAIHPITEMVTKERVGYVGRSNEGSGLKQKGNGNTNGIEIIEKHAWGTTKRVQKLPSLHLQPVYQVIRYRRHETAGRGLVGTVIAVKPSVEKFPMPSKKSQYHRRKALQWHVEEAPALHNKIQQFLSECDAVPRPAPSLNTRPVFFFSRHNPIVTTSTDSANIEHRAEEMTNRSNEAVQDVETMKREGANSIIRGHSHSVAITKEMMNRKHRVVTPHK